MEIPPPSVLIQRIRALPAGAALMDRGGDWNDVYLVGGGVRDLLLGGEPQDLDLVVEGAARPLAQRLGPPRSHDRFGTATVVLDGFSYDIARARTETYADPGALPDVKPAGLPEDLLRRDFTVNALAVALGGPEPGSLHHPPRALEDLDAGRLRVFHERSFIDDPTRLLRLVRYASRLQFEIEPETLELARSGVALGAFSTLSGSRIGSELRMLAGERDPVSAFELLARLEFDVALYPGFGIRDAALARRAIGLLPEDGRQDLVVLALAARYVPSHALMALLSPLEFVASDRDEIIAGAFRAEAIAHALEAASAPSEIARAVGDAGPDFVAIAGAIGPAEKARAWLQRLRHLRLEISGEDLLALGVSQGPGIGRGLRAALAAKLDGRVSGREQELAEARRAAAHRG